jgi:hypothetical protein
LRPSAWAVLRLISNSSFVGCSTEISRRKTLSCFGRADDATRGQDRFGGNSRGMGESRNAL